MRDTTSAADRVPHGRFANQFQRRPPVLRDVPCEINGQELWEIQTEGRRKVTYDHSCQTLGEYRAAQGYRRCPTCRRINKNIQFCDDYCRDKYEGNISLVLEIADTLKQKAQPQTAGFRFRCGNLACGTGRDDRNNRVRGRVATKGGLCSKECRRIVKEAAKQCHRPEKSEECILPPIECSKPLENGQNSSTF
jgi:hypothetical protein